MNILALGIIGLGIGLLSGLSTSPVLSVILTSLIAAAAAVTTVLAEYSSKAETEKKPRLAMSAWPLAILVVSIVVGAGIGGLARSSYALDRLVQVQSAAVYAPP